MATHNYHFNNNSTGGTGDAKQTIDHVGCKSSGHCKCSHEDKKEKEEEKKEKKKEEEPDDSKTRYATHEDIKKLFNATWKHVVKELDDAEKNVEAKKKALEAALAVESVDYIHRLDRHHGMIKLYIEAVSGDKILPGADPFGMLANWVNKTYSGKDKTDQEQNLPSQRMSNIAAVREAQKNLVAANKSRFELLNPILPDDKKAKMDKDLGEFKKLTDKLDEVTADMIQKLERFGMNGTHIYELCSITHDTDYDNRLAKHVASGSGAPERTFWANYPEWAENNDVVKTVRAANEEWRRVLQTFLSSDKEDHSFATLWADHKLDTDKMKKDLEAKLGKPVRDPYGESVGPGDKWTIAEVKAQIAKAEAIKKDYVTGEKNRFMRLTPLKSRDFFRGFCFPPCSSSTPFRLLDLFRASRRGLLFFIVLNMVFVVFLYGVSYGGGDRTWQRFHIALVSTPDGNKQVLYAGRLCSLTGPDIQTGKVTDCTVTGLHPKQFDGIGQVPGLERFELQSYWLLWLLPIVYGLLFLNDIARFWLVWRYQTGRNLKKKHFFLCEWDQYQQRVFDVVQNAGKSEIDAHMKDREEKVNQIMKGGNPGGKCPGLGEFMRKCSMARQDARTIKAIEAIWHVKVSQGVKEINMAICQAWVYMPTTTFPPALGAFLVALTQMVILAWIITVYLTTMDNLKEVARQSNATVVFGKPATAIYAVTLFRIMFDMYTAVGSLMYAVHDEYCTAIRAYRRLEDGDLIKNTFVGWKGSGETIRDFEKKYSWERKDIDPNTAARHLADAQVSVYRERFWGARYYNNTMDWVWRVATGRAHDQDATDCDIPPIWVAPDIGGEKLKWYSGADLMHSTRYYVFPGYNARRRNGVSRPWPNGDVVHRRGVGDLG